MTKGRPPRLAASFIHPASASACPNASLTEKPQFAQHEDTSCPSGKAASLGSTFREQIRSG
jgi:hypothetical protein